MEEFNSDDHYIYHCGQESLRRNEVAIIVNKRVQSSSWCSLKNDGMILVVSKANHSIPFNARVYALTSNAEEAEV